MRLIQLQKASKVFSQLEKLTKPPNVEISKLQSMDFSWDKAHRYSVV
jgi:hypothetical protein